MNRSEVSKIIKKAEKYREADENKQEAFRNFHNALCESSVMSVMEVCECGAFLDGVSHFDGTLHEILYWYIYEGPCVDYADWTINGKKYPAKTVSDIADIYFAMKENETH